MMVNLRVIINLLGLLTAINGVFMLLTLPFSIYYNEDWKALLWAALCAIIVGTVIWSFSKGYDTKDLRKREGYLIVALGWVFMSLTGTLPYIFTGTISEMTNAFFETISGYTTTGASILTDIEALPKGILFWRTLTQWIGGMGIVVLTIAILPLLGIGGMQLFVAEAPGPTHDKLHPRIKETAKRLWYVYFFLTLAETVLLMAGGMSFYDAVNHAMSTISTGGFSTRNASLTYYDSPYIEYVILVFMFLGGTNFTLLYFLFKGKFKKIYPNEEFRAYIGTVFIVGIIVALAIYSFTGSGFEKAFRDSIFQVVSMVTTTGFITVDYTIWSPFVTLVFFLLLFTGASAGSTSGGVKIVRHVILFKNSILELKRQIHPSAVIPVRYNGRAVSETVTYNIVAFILIYLTIFSFGSLIMAALGLDFMTAIGAVAATLGNTGTGIGLVGPAYNFSLIPGLGKWFLAFLMLLGRLELFTVLILFTPYFWSKS